MKCQPGLVQKGSKAWQHVYTNNERQFILNINIDGTDRSQKI